MYRVEDRGHETPCWIWERGTNGKKGYGYLTLRENGGKKNVGAHRWVYERERGPIPGRLPLDHLCRQNPCVNPDHLEPVTSRENTRRGRHVRLGLAGATAARLAYLTTSLTQKEIGEMLGVAGCTVRDALVGRTWRY